MICHNEPSRYQEVKYSTLCTAANIFGTIYFCFDICTFLNAHAL
jgi:hypothetical protein